MIQSKEIPSQNGISLNIPLKKESHKLNFSQMLAELDQQQKQILYKLENELLKSLEKKEKLSKNITVKQLDKEFSKNQAEQKIMQSEVINKKILKINQAKNDMTHSTVKPFNQPKKFGGNMITSVIKVVQQKNDQDEKQLQESMVINNHKIQLDCSHFFQAESSVDQIKQKRQPKYSIHINCDKQYQEMKQLFMIMDTAYSPRNKNKVQYQILQNIQQQKSRTRYDQGSMADRDMDEEKTLQSNIKVNQEKNGVSKDKDNQNFQVIFNTGEAVEYYQSINKRQTEQKNKRIQGIAGNKFNSVLNSRKQYFDKKSEDVIQRNETIEIPVQTYLQLSKKITFLSNAIQKLIKQKVEDNQKKQRYQETQKGKIFSRETLQKSNINSNNTDNLKREKMIENQYMIRSKGKQMSIESNDFKSLISSVKSEQEKKYVNKRQNLIKHKVQYEQKMKQLKKAILSGEQLDQKYYQSVKGQKINQYQKNQNIGSKFRQKYEGRFIDKSNVRYKQLLKQSRSFDRFGSTLDRRKRDAFKINIPKLLGKPEMKDSAEIIIDKGVQAIKRLCKDTNINISNIQNLTRAINVIRYNQCVIYSIDEALKILLIWHFSGKMYFGEGNINQNGIAIKHGKGIYIAPHQYVYQGQFKYDKMHGKGAINYQDGLVFKGFFKNNKIHGFGVMISYESYFEGHFEQGKKQGFGHQKFETGDEYIGEYLQNKFEGQGIYKWKNGTIYEGSFNEGLMSGRGTWKSYQGDEYVGQYHNNLKHGHGIYRWANGKIYEGQFDRGKPSDFISKAISTKCIRVENQIDFINFKSNKQIESRQSKVTRKNAHIKSKRSNQDETYSAKFFKSPFNFHFD